MSTSSLADNLPGFGTCQQCVWTTTSRGGIASIILALINANKLAAGVQPGFGQCSEKWVQWIPWAIRHMFTTMHIHQSKRAPKRSHWSTSTRSLWNVFYGRQRSDQVVDRELRGQRAAGLGHLELFMTVFLRLVAWEEPGPRRAVPVVPRQGATCI